MKEYLSPAKINIGLNIISKREDGYHNIETIFYPVKLFDKLTFYESNSFLIDCNDRTIPVDESNLIYKARNILSEVSGKKLNVRVKLEKNIPSYAGLGGGSSNAATTLIALNEIFELKLNQSELLKIASNIGSDVPFFILNIPVFAEGRGEILTPLPELILDYKILIVFPNIKISTEWAYSNFKISEKKIDLRKIKTFDDFERYKELITNDFESIIFKFHPEIEIIKNYFKKSSSIFSLLSGSGSSVYGMFEKDLDLSPIKNNFKHLRVFEC